MRPEFGAAERRNAEVLIDLALAEDLGQSGDLTATVTIPSQARGAARFVTRADGVVAGLPVVAILAGRFELGDFWQPLVDDGDRVPPGTAIARVAGSMRSLLALERTALNFLQRLGGIATLTARFVAQVAGTRAVILDTRKTTPGWRALEKYAVRRGGGRNHRIGLYDAILIKDNHLAWLAEGGDPIGSALAAARAHAPRGRSSRSRSIRSSSSTGPSSAVPTSSWWTTSAPRRWPRRSDDATAWRQGSCSRRQGA